MLMLFCSIFSIVEIQGQEYGNEQVKRVQRAIFVFNFAQQVGWPDLDDLKTFNIGVLGMDRTILDLESMAQKRKIFGKTVKIHRFQSVKSLKNIQLLYVHNKYNYAIDYILKKISGKKILLVTEDYNYNTSMIKRRLSNSSFITAIRNNIFSKVERIV